MRLFCNFISLFIFVLINTSSSNAFIKSKNISKKMNINNNLHFINELKIGIVDFRNILKNL